MQIPTKANFSAAWAIGFLRGCAGLALVRRRGNPGRLGARILLAMRRARLRQELWRIERADKLCASAPYRCQEDRAPADS